MRGEGKWWLLLVSQVLLGAAPGNAPSHLPTQFTAVTLFCLQSDLQSHLKGYLCRTLLLNMSPWPLQGNHQLSLLIYWSVAIWICEHIE